MAEFLHEKFATLDEEEVIRDSFDKDLIRNLTPKIKIREYQEQVFKWAKYYFEKYGDEKDINPHLISVCPSKKADGAYYLKQFATERSLCVNQTAAGGNAELPGVSGL